MKNQLTAILLFVIIAFSCKDQNKESNVDSENQNQKAVTIISSQDTVKTNSAVDSLRADALDENKKALADFFAKTNEEITDKIIISVKEYYKISDIILGKLSTTSNGNLLETGGMLNILATSNQEKCNLKKGKTIEIEFPRKVEKEGMQLYTG